MTMSVTMSGMPLARRAQRRRHREAVQHPYGPTLERFPVIEVRRRLVSGGEMTVHARHEAAQLALAILLV